MWNDVRFAFRTLKRSPLFTGVAVLSLALGIGANTAIFSLFDQVLRRLLPVRDPERLTLFHTEYQAPGMSMSDSFESVFSYPMYRDLRERTSAFSGVVARAGGFATVSFQDAAERATVETVSGNLFEVLGVGAVLGRTLTPADDGAPGANPVVVLSHACWVSRFGASPNVLNLKLLVNGHPMVVVGVAAPRFQGLLAGQTPDLFVPIAMKRQITPTWSDLEDRRTRWLNVFARLKPGISIQQAQVASDVIYRAILENELAAMGRMRNDHERDLFLNHRIEIRPASQGINELRRRWQTPLVVLMAMVGLVLLIACANVAGLMLARAAGRRREIAVRLAVGAGRGVLVRQLLVESLLVALAGGALGLIFAAWSSDVLIRVLPRDQTGGWLTAAVDPRLLAFNFALSVATGLLFGLAPALAGTRPDVAGTLKNQAAGVASGGQTARFRKALVTAQLALSLLLVVGAGLFTRSLANLMRVDLGFRTEQLQTFSVDATLTRPDPIRAKAFYDELRQRLAALPGVTGVGAADSGPFSNSNRGGNITVEGYEPKEDEVVGASMCAAGPGFFRALGIRLIAGREFSESDDAGSPKTIVINEAFAKRYFEGRDPIGRHLMFGASNRPVLDREIVGVAADSRADVRKPARPALYYPYAQWNRPDRLTFYVRSTGGAGPIASEIRRVARETDPNVPMTNLKPMTVRVEESIYADRLIAMLAAAFGVLASLLAAIGLYGVMAYAVARRTSEIGIRMALGALPTDVLRMVLKEASTLAAVGIAIGLLGAFALSRFAQSQLFGIQAHDPAIFIGASVLLGAIALVAGLVPGWRASRTDPVSALKYE